MISKTSLLILLLVFYGFIIVMYGLVFSDIKNFDMTSENLEITNSTKVLTINNIVKGLTNVPLWFNIIIFTPLFIGLSFLLVTSIIGGGGS